MKRINLLLTILLLVVIIGSCTKENQGTINPVSNVTATPFIGAVKITFNIPIGKDYYYTLITYKNAKGNAISKKVSVYDALNGITTATIGGFTDTNEHEFSLTNYGFSGASSTTVTVKGTPEDISTAMNYVIGTVNVKATDMGAQLSWTNESGIGVNLIATYKDSKGNDKTITLDASKTDSASLRGFLTQTAIKIVAQNVADGNKSEVKTFNIAPLLPPEDIIQDGIDYITFNSSTADPQMTLTQPNPENPYQYEIVTTGNDPHVEINKLVNPRQGTTLTFRYKSNLTVSLELFWEDVGGGAAGGRSSVVTVPAASDWTTFTHDYSGDIIKYKWAGNVGDGIRWDPAFGSGDTIDVRNIHWE